MQQPIMSGIIDIEVQSNAIQMGIPPDPITTNPTVRNSSPPIIQKEAKQHSSQQSNDLFE